MPTLAIEALGRNAEPFFALPEASLPAIRMVEGSLLSLNEAPHTPAAELEAPVELTLVPAVTDPTLVAAVNALDWVTRA